MYVCMAEKVKEVLVLGPRSQREYAAIEKAKASLGSRYKFHTLHPPKPIEYGSTMPSEEFSKTLDLLGFVDIAVKYVRRNNISGVIFDYDNAALVGAAVCEETGLPGPSFESEFLCLHKYYSRKAEPSRLWCECVFLSSGNETDSYAYIHDVDKEDQRSRLCKTSRQTGMIQYPCFVKPATLTGSLGIAKVHGPSDLAKLLSIYSKHIPPLVHAFDPLFRRYLNLQLYPLALAPVAVVEELVEDKGEYHCLEGWVDSSGLFHHWATYDSISCNVCGETIVGFFIPSLEPSQSITAIIDHTATAISNHKLKSVFFNVDLWKRGDRVDIIEINGRCTPSMIGMYKVLYSSSVYAAMVYLACEEEKKCEEESPSSRPPPALHGGRFRWYTNRKGKASDVLDFPRAQTIGVTDEELYDAAGNRSNGITLYVNGDTYVSAGTQLGMFVMYGSDRLQLWQRAKQVISQLMHAQ